ncbi:MAG: galactokinase [Bacteroidia bacterium]
MIQHILELYHQHFSYPPVLVNAPGRINLIGEHTDYNEGFVLPAAIDKSIVFALAPNHTNTCRLVAADLNDHFETTLTDLKPVNKSWANYVLGVVYQFQQHGYPVGGFDCVFGGDVPVGAGLSSSAAVECGTGYALSLAFGLNISRMDLVKMAQKAEHTFAGVQCGIMDQFASTFGKNGHVVRLDCRSLDYEYFPFDMSGYKLLLCDTKVTHALSDSEYNTRRQECESGVTTLRNWFPGIHSLRDVTSEMLASHRYDFDPVIFKRCSFVVAENERVHQTCKALNEGNLPLAGKLIYQSHEGLQHLYEVSCPELDFLVDQTRDNPFVLGARMMGGGFGGCTLNLVRTEEADRITNGLKTAYESRFGITPGIYLTAITDGVREIPVSHVEKLPGTQSNR